jgi:cyclase
LDVRNGRVVKGTKFTDLRDVDDPATLGKYYSEQGADELVFYDITASSDERDISLEFVRQVAKEVNIPFCVGGGVKNIDDFQRILRAGADKISVNSGAVKHPELIREAANRFGSQCVVLSIDAKRKDDGTFRVTVKGGREETALDAVAWAKQGVALGAGEIVVNSIDADGMKQGYDIELLRAITSSVNVPVIASGGAGTMAHFAAAIREADVDGILAASVFHYKTISIKDLKSYLSQKGIAIWR